MWEILGYSALFLASAALVIRSGLSLAKAGDAIAEGTGLGRLWVGTIFLAIATSLPELVTNISAVRIGAAGLAAGNILGANMLNIVVLASLLSLFPRVAVSPLTLDQRILGGAALLLTALVLAFKTFPMPLGPLSLGSFLILGVYSLAMYWVYRTREGGDAPKDSTAKISLRRAWLVFALAAGGILIGAPALAFSADRLSDLLGVSGTFIGVLAVALVTTMPETSVTYGSLRLGSQEMAMGNVYGSCAFNVAILALADFFYPKPIYVALGFGHIVAGLGALFLMGVGLLFIWLRARSKFLPSLILALLIAGSWMAVLFWTFRAGA